MGKRQKDWARNERFRLMFLLGGCCAVCGSTQNLTFDCIKPQGNQHHALDTERRMIFYRRQHAVGNVQILCNYHNAKKGCYDETTPY